MRSMLAVLVLTATAAAACIPKGGHIPESLPPVQPTGGQNPFAGAKLFVDAGSQAMAQAKQAGGAQGKLLRMIANQPQADWLGDWTPNIQQAVDGRIRASTSAGALRVMVAYNIPNRDCGLYSKGGVDDTEDYRRWITFFARGSGAHCPARPCMAESAARVASAARWPAFVIAFFSAPTTRPRTRPGSRKRTSALAGWTLTSTSRGSRSRKSAVTGCRSDGSRSA